MRVYALFCAFVMFIISIVIYIVNDYDGKSNDYAIGMMLIAVLVAIIALISKITEK